MSEKLTVPTPLTPRSLAPASPLLSFAEQGLRLKVYIDTTKVPLTVEIEFPNADLAARYRRSIQGKKVLPEHRQESMIVAFELPPTVQKLETNGGYGCFIVHFDQNQQKSADRWADVICREMKKYPHQMNILQYFDKEGRERVERYLSRYAPLNIEEPPQPAGSLPEPPAKLPTSPTFERSARVPPLQLAREKEEKKEEATPKPASRPDRKSTPPPGNARSSRSSKQWASGLNLKFLKLDWEEVKKKR